VGTVATVGNPVSKVALLTQQLHQLEEFGHGIERLGTESSLAGWHPGLTASLIAPDNCGNRCKMNDLSICLKISVQSSKGHA
jgi:hypothetical protein